MSSKNNEDPWEIIERWRVEAVAEKKEIFWKNLPKQFIWSLVVVVSLITTTIGLITLSSNYIEWNGWFEILINFWIGTIRATIAGFLNGLLTITGVLKVFPNFKIPDPITDYLAVGILIGLGALRSDKISKFIRETGLPSDTPWPPKDKLSKNRVKRLFRNFFMALVFWPFTIAALVRNRILRYQKKLFDTGGEQAAMLLGDENDYITKRTKRFLLSDVILNIAPIITFIICVLVNLALK